MALALVNFGQDSFLRGISLHLKEAGAARGWKAYDVWEGKNLGPIEDHLEMLLKRHSTLLLRLSR